MPEGGGMRGTPSGGASAVSLLRVPGAWKRDENRNTGGRLEEEARKQQVAVPSQCQDTQIQDSLSCITPQWTLYPALLLKSLSEEEIEGD